MKELTITIKNLCYVVTGKLNIFLKIFFCKFSIQFGDFCNFLGGIVCFFTSYDNLNNFYNNLSKDEGLLKSFELKKKIFVEPRESGRVDKMLEDYGKAIKCAKSTETSKNGAILFSVIVSKLSQVNTE